MERSLDQIPVKGSAERLLTTPPGRVPVEEAGADEAEAETGEESKAQLEGRAVVHYFDERSNKYAVDTAAMEARLVQAGGGEEQAGGGEEDGFVAAFRAALNAALEKYASVKFHEGGAKASGFVFSSPPCAQIFISAHNESFKNFRVGTWASQWQADLDLGAGGFTLKVGRGGSQQGQVRLHAHYFEDGNLMFKIEKMLAGSGSADGPAALAEAVVRQIVDL